MTVKRATKVVFRVDASLLIGSGHVIRCLTLAEAMKVQGAECHFITRTHPGHLSELIRNRGFSVFSLPLLNHSPSHNDNSDSPREPFHSSWLSCDWQTDAYQTRIILDNLTPDFLLVDHYALDYRWESELRSCSNQLIVIDDLADRPHECDLLLDQNLGRDCQDYINLVPSSCHILVGSQYAILGPDFSALRSYSLQRRQKPVIKSLLISMGGVDQSNFTGQILQVLKSCSLPADFRITVVMGPRAPWVDQVRAQAKNMSVPTEVLVNINDMAQRMADSDLAIGAAGSTSWERCCLGLPSLMFVLADNQCAIAEALHNAGASITLDSLSDLPVKLKSLLADPSLLHDMSIAASNIVNGFGTDQILAHLTISENL